MTDIALTISRDEFLRRFKCRLHNLLVDYYDAKYINYIALTYWDALDYRAEGPEECAEAEFLEWCEE